MKLSTGRILQYGQPILVSLKDVCLTPPATETNPTPVAQKQFYRERTELDNVDWTSKGSGGPEGQVEFKNRFIMG